jgi:hypothetical protein
MIRVRGAAPVPADQYFAALFHGFSQQFPRPRDLFPAGFQRGIPFKQQLKL